MSGGLLPEEQRPVSGPKRIRVGFARAAGYVVNTLSLEDYVARVVAGEAAPGSAPSALEVLAITIRTFGVANLNRHRTSGFDLCDQTHCQVVRAATEGTRRSAEATEGRVLLYGGGLASVFYTASCGGRSEVPSEVWADAIDLPYLRSHKDSACRGMSEWTVDFASDDLLQALRAAGLRGDTLRQVRVIKRNRSGRVASVKLSGLRPETLSGAEFRLAVARTLGWQRIRSAAFDVKRVGGVYRFRGRGSGHGVGLCVIGATRLAADGRRVEQILRDYFPGTVIGRLK